jgi:hypothetical protein
VPGGEPASEIAEPAGRWPLDQEVLAWLRKWTRGAGRSAPRRSMIKWSGFSFGGGVRKKNVSGLLKHDPIPWLLSLDDPAITAFVRRDLLGQRIAVKALWELREPLRLIGKQQADGSWRYPTKKPQSSTSTVTST